MNRLELHDWALKAHEEKRYDDALQGYNELMGQVPNFWYYPYLVGTWMIEKGFSGVAMHLLERALALDPQEDQIPAILANLGVCYRREGHEDRAEEIYKRAYELKPDVTIAGNRTGLYVNAGNPDRCIDMCDEILKDHPDLAQVKSHKALALLEKGDPQGWQLYDARFELDNWHQRTYPGPMWDGSPVDTLVVHGEQGLGDEILFCSLIHDVKQRCKNLVIECNFKLVKLFERSFGVPCYPDEKHLMEHHTPDAWIPMGSLPRVLSITKPIWEMHKSRQRKGYLIPPHVHHDGGKPKIGLSWYGGTKETHGNLRRFGLDKWQQLIKPQFEYVSLQYGNAEKDCEKLGIPFVPVTDDLDEFAGRVASCDLVISVCNTTVHFGGGLNVPTWVLVPSRPAWRYGLRGERMFWYHSTRMFRQTSTWTEVVDKVEAALADLS